MVSWLNLFIVQLLWPSLTMSNFEFTPDQLAAINSQSNMVITACPGSGKTTVISQKIKNNVEDLPYYKGVIAITFTIKASRELKSRCKKGGKDTKASFFGTIDQFCLSEIIYPFWANVLCRKKSEFECLKYAELPQSLLDKLTIIPYLQKEPSSCSYDELIDDFIIVFDSGFVILEYLGTIANYILKNSPACIRYIKARYTEVYIDEYQDSSEVQHNLFLNLMELGLIGVAVGDVQQSIYAWRGSDPAYISQLTEQPDIFEHHIVNINHRCHPSIANYANRLFDSNCALLEADEIRVYRKEYNGSHIEVSAKLNSLIDTALRTGKASSYGQIGILVRNNVSLEYLSRGLDMPFRIFDEDLLAKRNTKVCNIFAHLLRFRFDASYRINDVVEYLESSVFKSKCDLQMVRGLIAHVGEKNHEELASTIAETTELLLESSISDSDKTLIEAICLDNQALKHYKLLDQNEVQVMTLHKSKGLEFEVVFHLDLYDWVHPKRKFIQGCYDVVYDNWEQELNLHFVGITRAINYCVLITSTNRINSQHQIKNANPSQFLSMPGLGGLYR